MKRVHRDNMYFHTSGEWIEGSTIMISRLESSGRIPKKYRRKVKFNRTDGLYFMLDNKKYFEYEFEVED